MNFNQMYDNLVRPCKTCNGTGTIDKTERSITFCNCMKFYIFAVRNFELGVPFQYIMSYTLGNPLGSGVHSFFKEDEKAFNHFMTTAFDKNAKVVSATTMYELSDFRNLDVVIVYNLGLESFQNNGQQLYRIVTEIRNRKLIGIFSFAIDKDRLAYHYQKPILSVIL